MTRARIAVGTWFLTITLVVGVHLAGCGEETEPDHLGTFEAAVGPICPGNSVVEGIDVSTYQGTVNWHSVKSSGRHFGIARVSDGTHTIDHTFPTNWSGMKAAGLIRGAYQFFRPAQDAIAQANIMINAVGHLGPGDLAPTLDVEATDGQSHATMASKIRQWVDHVKQATGRTPIIYSGSYFWNDNVGSTAFSSNPLWLAQYGPHCPTPPTAWSKWTFHQYSSTGSVPGISGNVDLDRFNGSLAQLEALADGAGGADWGATYVSQSFPLASQGAVSVHSGQSVNASITLRNTGSKAWNSHTKLAPTPRDQASKYADAGWLSPTRIVAVTGTVAPGDTFKFSFKLHGPAATGTHSQTFGLVQEGVHWFSDSGQGGPADGLLEAKITVLPAVPGVMESDGGVAGGDDAGAPREADGGAEPPSEADAGTLPSHPSHPTGSTAAPGIDAGGPSPTPTATPTPGEPPAEEAPAGTGGSDQGLAAGATGVGATTMGGCQTTAADPIGGLPGGGLALAALLVLALAASRRRVPPQA